MNKYKNSIKFLFFGLLIPIVFSCQQVKDFLEKPPTSDITIDTVFASRTLATQAMTACYLNLPVGIPTLAGPGNGKDDGNNKPLCCVGQGVTDDLTDLMTDIGSSGGNLTGPRGAYYPGTYNSSVEDNNPSFVKYSFTQEGQWDAIRRCWQIIEHIDRVPDMSDVEKAQYKAEARVIIALHYTEMLRNLGGVPKVDHVYLPNDNLTAPRMTVREMLDWINQLIEDSYNDLPYNYADINMYGRMTRIGALAIRVRAFHFAASPLFNDDQPYLEGAASEARYCWLGEKDPDLWKQTRDYADQLIAESEANGYGLVQPASQDLNGYRTAYQTAYFVPNNGEMLIATRSRNALYQSGNAPIPYYAQGTFQPTQNWIDMFPMANGYDIKPDQPNYAPGWDEQKPTDNRDPRLYESVAVNNGDWGNGATPYARLWQGGQEQVTGALCYHGTCARKFSLGGSGTNALAVGKQLVFPYIRLAEIYLIYAEAANQYEGSPSPLAYARVNAIRERVGLFDLPAGMSQKKFHEAVMKERCCEFGMENVRWFDIVRWKMSDAFTATLREQKSWLWLKNSGYNVTGKIQATRDNSYTGDYLIGDNVIGQSGVIYQKLVVSSNPNDPKPNVNFDPTLHVITYQYFNFPDIEIRAWAKNFSPKWYLSAFPMKEVNKGYGLIQNPGW